MEFDSDALLLILKRFSMQKYQYFRYIWQKYQYILVERIFRIFTFQRSAIVKTFAVWDATIEPATIFYSERLKNDKTTLIPQY